MIEKVGGQWKEEMVTLTENFEQRLQVTLILRLLLVLTLILNPIFIMSIPNLT